jgi:hypothetical protein
MHRNAAFGSHQGAGNPATGAAFSCLKKTFDRHASQCYLVGAVQLSMTPVTVP